MVLSSLIVLCDSDALLFLSCYTFLLFMCQVKVDKWEISAFPYSGGSIFMHSCYFEGQQRSLTFSLYFVYI